MWEHHFSDLAELDDPSTMPNPVRFEQMEPEQLKVEPEQLKAIRANGAWAAKNGAWAAKSS